jgi:peptidoglycan/xylan/chitin deacetylase (PgdA/CDA1 family)
METIIICFFVFLCIYMFIPYILSFWFGVGAFRKGNVESQVAFTFDDGPDPVYTAQLLDLLKKYGVKATFFVVGSKAKKYPKLILRMHKEGHLIGIHNYVHRSNWLMTPWSVARNLRDSATIVQNITGVRPTYYRPPWGLMNLFDFFLHKEFHIILWSVMAGDWRNKGTSVIIQDKLLKRIKPGDVVLLHDCGDTLGAHIDAPYYMLKALKEVLKELRQRNIQFVRLDEMMDKRPIKVLPKRSQPHRKR